MIFYRHGFAPEMAIKARKTAIRSTATKKRSDTQIATIEKKYGKDYVIRLDRRLGTYLKKDGYGSLTVLLKNGKK